MKAGAHEVSLIVFVRRPRPGAVKRRLARSIGARRAAGLYAALLERTLRLAVRAGYSRLILMPAWARDCAWFRARCGRAGWLIKPQVSGDLGQRMERALGAELAQGRAAVLIGSDIADFTATDLVRARGALVAGADAVLGPAADGGYWLIGLSHALPGLFRRMAWSSASVAATTTARLADAGCDVERLATRHDLDRARDLRVARISARARPARVFSACFIRA